MDDVDCTPATRLVEFAQELSERNLVLAVAEAHRAVVSEFDEFGRSDAIGRDHVDATRDDAIAAFHAS
ncbi:MAG: hypothetical protein ACXVSL_08765 [Solirubrobacteraceae bacterium]